MTHFGGDSVVTMRFETKCRLPMIQELKETVADKLEVNFEGPSLDSCCGCCKKKKFQKAEKWKDKKRKPDGIYSNLRSQRKALVKKTNNLDQKNIIDINVSKDQNGSYYKTNKRDNNDNND
ncbi:hypothetical protein C2G38_2178413 [Gigaspora rosea]|uniref:Uncharacterized protein n=1 Tax=Gigaspora rosea TaxID=44941 RepID=A0A397VNK6_9GLOM|nr:hypothetical protein C2G38_2178413 [Gigaspora rosea]